MARARSSPRRVVLAIAAATAGVIAVLGLALWRTLPSPLPDAPSLEDAVAPTYIADLPFALDERRLDGVRFAVLDEPENVQLTPPGFYEAELALWRELLTGLGAEATSAAQAELLVVPEARCLGLESRRVIAEHLRAGGGMITTDVLGARDGQCRELRDTLLVELLGGGDAPVIATLPASDTGSVYASVLGETVLGAGLPPGARLEQSPAQQTVFRGRDREVYYSTYQHEPRVVAGETYFDGAAVRAAVGPGRLVAFGFPASRSTGAWSRAVFRRLAANAAAWAAGRSVAQLAPWPRGLKAAAVLAQDVEADFGAGRAAAELVADLGLPSTHFAVGILAERDPETTETLRRTGEFATHTHLHLPLDTFPDDQQIVQLQRSKAVAERLAGRPVVGMRPPEERMKLATLQAWADLGGLYVFAYNDRRSSAPEIIPFMPDSLVLLARAGDDDFELLARSELSDRSAMVDRLLDQLRRVVAVRGLYMFSYHSHIMAQGQLLPVLAAVGEALESSPEIWTTTAERVARWWLSRAAVAVVVQQDGAVLLRNTAETPFTDGILLVDTPDGRRLRYRVDALQPGEERRITIPAR